MFLPPTSILFSPSLSKCQHLFSSGWFFVSAFPQCAEFNSWTILHSQLDPPFNQLTELFYYLMKILIYQHKMNGRRRVPLFPSIKFHQLLFQNVILRNFNLITFTHACYSFRHFTNTSTTFICDVEAPIAIKVVVPAAAIIIRDVVAAVAAAAAVVVVKN